MDLEEFYNCIGGDFADTRRRLMSEVLIKKFVLKYQGDSTFADMKVAVEERDWETAFRGAHTLKGLAQNLGFEQLYQASFALTEAMRGNKPLEDKSLLEKVKQENDAVLKAISEIE